MTFLSILGEMVQTLGVLSITLLFLMLYRVLLRAYFLRWAQAWLALLIALFSLHLAFSVGSLRFLEILYFAGEYVFAALLWLGFATFPERDLSVRRHLYWLLPIIGIWSLALSLFGGNFGNRFSLHATAFTLALIPAWIALCRLRLPGNYTWVKLAAITSLLMLILNFVLGASPIFWGDWARGVVHDSYFAFQSIFDLMFEVLLAFSLLVIAAVNMKGELERANEILQGERDNMSMLANRDALTGCLNRHALDELQTRLRDRSGLVAMVDINDLKPINDNFGHHIGDEAICRVAQTIKAHMRSQDYFFRYGGDEFVIVSFEMQEVDAEQRLQDIQRSLASLPITDLVPCVLSISWGIQQFSDERSFIKAVHAADSLMYQQKLTFHQTPI
ncbi:GGDEF domain-containing protein [Cellvibrio zantedeschiae]|uniref:GGDEF domain-containing protein n=1 Tax=Cellvibrio zantedeschiae TaxID=1237077 RepID=UPI0016754D3F|nr:diguanylate cyclase [Cellvibrio zantedeschiae]